MENAKPIAIGDEFYWDSGRYGTTDITISKVAKIAKTQATFENGERMMLASLMLVGGNNGWHRISCRSLTPTNREAVENKLRLCRLRQLRIDLVKAVERSDIESFASVFTESEVAHLIEALRPQEG